MILFATPACGYARSGQAEVSVSVVAPPTKNDFDYSTVNLAYADDNTDNISGNDDSATPTVKNIWIRLKNKIVSFFRNTGSSMMARL